MVGEEIYKGLIWTKDRDFDVYLVSESYFCAYQYHSLSLYNVVGEEIYKELNMDKGPRRFAVGGEIIESKNKELRRR